MRFMISLELVLILSIGCTNKDKTDAGVAGQGAMSTGGAADAGHGTNRGGTGGTPGAGGGGIASGSGEAADFLSRFGSVFCSRVVACGMSRDRDTCRRDFTSPNWLGLDELALDIDAGRVRYDSAKAAACLSTSDTSTCFGSAPTSVCSGVLTGTVALGGSCVRDEECAQGKCRKWSCGSACCAGRCSQLGATGEICRSSAECADGGDCILRTALSWEPTCQPRPGKGQPCEKDQTCQSGLVCDTTGSKTCIARPTAGEACVLGGPECSDGGDFCDPSTLKCRPRIPVGGSCTVPDGGIPRIGGGCVFWATCAGGVCTALAGKGEACSLSDAGNIGYPCRVGTCIAGTCQIVWKPCTIATAIAPDGGVPGSADAAAPPAPPGGLMAGATGLMVRDRLIGDEKSYVEGFVMVERDGKLVGDAQVTLNGVTLPPMIGSSDAPSPGFYDPGAVMTQKIPAGATLTLAVTQGGDAVSVDFTCPDEVAITKPGENTQVSSGQSLTVTWSGTLDTSIFPPGSKQPQDPNYDILLPYLMFRDYDSAKQDIGSRHGEQVYLRDLTANSSTVTVPAWPGMVLELFVKGKQSTGSRGKAVGGCSLVRRVILRGT